MMEELGYDIELIYVKKETEQLGGFDMAGCTPENWSLQEWSAIIKVES